MGLKAFMGLFDSLMAFMGVMFLLMDFISLIGRRLYN